MRLLITARMPSWSNGLRLGLWKVELQKLADETGSPCAISRPAPEIRFPCFLTGSANQLPPDKRVTSLNPSPLVNDGRFYFPELIPIPQSFYGTNRICEPQP